MAIARFQIISVDGRESDTVSWRFLSGNNRSMARSVPTFPNVESCLAAILELPATLAAGVGSTVRNGSGMWMWRIRAEELDVAMSSGRYERRLRARMACDSFKDVVVAARSVEAVQVVRF